jgi:glycosyltransferase involved in cell wall biosynthesis
VFCVAVVMPVFNEGDGLEETLKELELVGATSNVHLHLFVQDDRSADDSVEILHSYQSDKFSLHLESNAFRLGHGASVRRGYERAIGSDSSVTIQLDGDGQFRSEDVVRLIRTIRSGRKFAWATRKLRSGPGYRRLGTMTLRLLILLFFNRKIADVNSPIRAFSTEFLEKILPCIPKDSVIPNVHLSVLCCRYTDLIESFDVVDQVRRGASEQGTSWSSSGRDFLSPLRFFVFALKAFWGVVQIRLQLLRRTNDSSIFSGAG